MAAAGWRSGALALIPAMALAAPPAVCAAEEVEETLAAGDHFGDLGPGDWAYQALFRLVKRYGCLAGYPGGTFAGGRPLGRLEAAALLNGCLNRISEVTDELKALLEGFQKEFSLLKARGENLDARVARLQEVQFSPTTTLSGMATYVMGAVGNNPLGSAMSFNYDIQLELATSFTGKDRLITILRGGNFDPNNNAFGAGLSTLEVAYGEEDGNDYVFVDKLYYGFPLGGGFGAVIGARVEQIDLLPLWPSVYPEDTVLDVLFLNGAPLAYNKNYGAGVGLSWQANGLSLAANYVAVNGSQSSAGMFAANSAGTATVQVGYQREQWAIAAIYSYLQAGVDPPGGSSFVSEQLLLSSANSFGLSGYWQPLSSGWMPSISLGYGYSYSSAGSALKNSQSWLVGLQWTDAFVKGNSFGTALGAPAYATAVRSGDPEANVLAWEAWYKFQLTDAISLTPAIFYLTNPGDSGNPGGPDQLGALVKMSFKF